MPLLTVVMRRDGRQIHVRASVWRGADGYPPSECPIRAFTIETVDEGAPASAALLELGHALVDLLTPQEVDATLRLLPPSQ